MKCYVIVRCVTVLFLAIPRYLITPYGVQKYHMEEDVGLLVQVGFDITAFTPPAYQRGSLPRPSKDVSS